MLYMYILLYYKIICILCPLQEGATPLCLAVIGGHTTCVEHLLSTPGIDVNIKDTVSVIIEYICLFQYV